MTRRLPALILAVAALVAVIVAAREPIEAETPTFSVSASGWMPAAPPTTGLTETWFCLRQISSTLLIITVSRKPIIGPKPTIGMLKHRPLGN